MGLLPLEIPVGFRVCLGASPALHAIAILFMLADDTLYNSSFFPDFRQRDLILPSILVELATFVLVPIGTPHHLSGMFFGALYFVFKGQAKLVWEVVRIAAGNRYTDMVRQADTILADGTCIPSFHILLSDVPLRLVDRFRL